LLRVAVRILRFVANGDCCYLETTTEGDLITEMVLKPQQQENAQAFFATLEVVKIREGK